MSSRERIASYYGKIELIDEQVGRLIAAVELVDIAPALAELAGVELGQCDGRSLTPPILMGRSDPGDPGPPLIGRY